MLYFKQNGFSLIEILIVLMIIGIVSSLSIAHYSTYFAKEKRLEAISLLQQLSLAMENYYFEAHTYEHVTLKDLKISTTHLKNNYQFSIQTENGDGYVLMAKPLSHQTEHDIECGTLKLYANGKKEVTGSAGLDNCW